MRFLIIVFLFCACTLFSKAREENLGKVQPGMTQAELLDVLGEPETKETVDDGQRWHYQIMSSDNRHYDPYTGIFEKGVLTKWYFNLPEHEDEKKVPTATRKKNRGTGGQ